MFYLMGGMIDMNRVDLLELATSRACDEDMRLRPQKMTPLLKKLKTKHNNKWRD